MLSKKEDFYVRGCWGPREESLKQCAHRVSTFVRKLGELTPVFKKWYEFEAPKARPIGTSQAAIADLLSASVSKTDVGDRTISEAGFEINLWNRRDDEARTSLNICCGIYSPWISNMCFLQPEFLGRVTIGIPGFDILIQLVKLIVRTWDPDDVVVTSRLTRERLPRVWDGPDIGWITYLSDRYGEVAALPKVSRCERIDNAGTLIVVTEPLFSCDSDEDLGRLRDAQTRLKMESRPKLRKYVPTG